MVIDRQAGGQAIKQASKLADRRMDGQRHTNEHTYVYIGRDVTYIYIYIVHT